VSRPTLSVSNGSPDTPPRRVKNIARPPGRSQAMWSPSALNGAWRRSPQTFLDLIGVVDFGRGVVAIELQL
jgi:hypothetical protein